MLWNDKTVYTHLWDCPPKKYDISINCFRLVLLLPETTLAIKNTNTQQIPVFRWVFDLGFHLPLPCLSLLCLSVSRTKCCSASQCSTESVFPSDSLVTPPTLSMEGMWTWVVQSHSWLFCQHGSAEFTHTYSLNEHTHTCTHTHTGTRFIFLFSKTKYSLFCCTICFQTFTSPHPQLNLTSTPPIRMMQIDEKKPPQAVLCFICVTGTRASDWHLSVRREISIQHRQSETENWHQGGKAETSGETRERPQHRRH